MNNYALQALHAKKIFLTYDQQELIERCQLRYDASYFYIDFLGEPHRVSRSTGDMHRQHMGQWVDANSFNELMTVFDWLCDSRADRYISGRWVNIVTYGHSFHTGLQDDISMPYARRFDCDPEGFAAACLTLKGEKLPGGDLGYAIELMDGLRVFVQLWRSDEEFPPKLCCLWDENTTRYIRYETTWYALGLLLERIVENMPVE